MKKVIFADDMERRILLATVLLLGALTAAAQEKQPSWVVRTARSIFNGLTARNKTLDSTYVFQPTLKWTAAQEDQFIRLGADLHSDITVTDLMGTVPQVLTGTMETGLQNRPYWKMGIAAGYGALRLGYGIRVGKRKEDHDRYFSFGLTGSCYTARIQYYKINQYPVGTLTFDGLPPVDLASAYPGEMRNFTLDATYAFNRSRFVFGATYNGRILQRRSAGSWLVTAKYLQGDFSLDDRDPLWSRLKDLRRYTTQQVSAGGGYSFNWVLFHRDPTDPKTAGGLRNLTVNATALPMLSFYNHIQTEQRTADGILQVRYQGKPAFTGTARSALCYSINRVNITLSASYDRFGFHGVETEVSEEQGRLRTKVNTRGDFYDLSVEAKINVRF